jgi:hypothetical protein
VKSPLCNLLDIRATFLSYGFGCHAAKRSEGLNSTYLSRNRLFSLNLKKL